MRDEPDIPYGAPGTVIHLEGRPSRTESRYIGEVGGRSFAIKRDNGDQLVELSRARADELGLRAGKRRFPAVLRQLTPDGCVGAALGYLTALRTGSTAAAAFSQVSSTPFLSTSALSGLGWLKDPRNPAIGTAKVQFAAVDRALSNMGLAHHETDDRAELLASLYAGKPAFLGVIAAEEYTIIEDESGSARTKRMTLKPYDRGTLGHAMVAVGAVKGAFDTDWLLLADPYAGIMTVVEADRSVLDAIQYAFIIDN